MYEHTLCVNNSTWSIYQSSIQLSNLLTYESEAKSPDIWKYIPKLFYSAWCQDDREGFQLSDSFNGDNFIEVVTTGDRRLDSWAAPILSLSDQKVASASGQGRGLVVARSTESSECPVVILQSSDGYRPKPSNILIHYQLFYDSVYFMFNLVNIAIWYHEI